MPQDGMQRKEVSFNSFLAGVLLTKKCIDNFVFFNMMDTFERHYNVDVISDNSDLCVSIYLDDIKIKLNSEYSDVILVNSKKILVSDYLYSFTTPIVREFFNIPDIELLSTNKSTIFKNNPFIRTLKKNKKKAII